MRRPRRDVILRRFMAGFSLREIVRAARGSGLHRLDIEQIIRDALNGKGRIP